MRLRDTIKFCLPHGLLECRREWQRRRMVVAAEEVPVPFLLADSRLEELFPGIGGVEIVLPACLVKGDDYMVSPLKELLVLGAICRFTQPGRLFEFGTYTGVATLVCAMNGSPSATLDTLDLDPAVRATHVHGMGKGGFPDFIPGSAFRETPYGGRIRQRFGDSRSFDFTPYAKGVDLVFIDADHTYDFVLHDTTRALEMVRPGGILVWDDYIYTAEHPECSGVARCLNELAERFPCRHIAGTRLAVCRMPV